MQLLRKQCSALQCSTMVRPDAADGNEPARCTIIGCANAYTLIINVAKQHPPTDSFHPRCYTCPATMLLLR